jgi:hypothetical protein
MPKLFKLLQVIFGCWTEKLDPVLLLRRSGARRSGARRSGARRS